MTEEIWVPIEKWEGLYEVSNRGRVRSLPRVREPTPGVKKSRLTWPGQILKSSSRHAGHQVVSLRDSPRHESEYLHRLVARAFLPNPNNYPLVRHLDDNPKNNDVTNLAWGTYSDNSQDRWRDYEYPLREFCVRDHLMTPENSRKQQGGIVCRRCNTVSARYYKEKKRIMTETGKEVAYLVADCESTGINVFEDRIVQFFIGLADSEGNLLSSREWILNPGVDVPVEASDIHGYTTEYLVENGQDIKEGLSEIREYLIARTDIPWVLFNANYDLSILNEEFKRHDISTRFGEFVTNRAKVIDGLVIDRHHDKYRRGKRTLAAQADHYGVEYDAENLHDARVDVALTAQVTVKILEKFGTPTTAEQSVWYAQWAKNFQRYLRENDPEAVVDSEWPLKTKGD